jgi:threonylcarbamoyladenosine tRNA methylthiotransferase MtaB
VTRVAIATLGCRTNQAESAALARELERSGCTLVPYPGPADAVLVNTCTVTRGADADSRHAIRRAAAAAPGALVVVTGCFAQVQPAAAAAIPGVDYVVGRADAARIPALVFAGRPAKTRVVRGPLPRAFDGALSHGADAARARAFLKVQDGCDQRCGFCIVPVARGRSRSLAPAAARARLAALAAEGFVEVTITGIHLGDYGRDLDPPCTLADLLDALDAAEAVPRLRLSSLFPSQLTPAFAARLGAIRSLVPHLHLSLQSGDDAVLARMRRAYRRSDIAAGVEAAVAALPGLGLGADLIVGYPGEDEAAFEATVGLVEALPLGYLHVFPFSARPGTAASRLDAQVPGAVVTRRARRLRALGAAKRAAWHGRSVGRTLEVLVERAGDEGRSREYLRVRLDRPEPRLAGRAVPVTVLGDLGDAVLGRPA